MINSKKVNGFQERIREERGFTFVELIVVLFIFGVLASVILFRFSDFNSAISRSNLAQEVALTIKQAQTDAVSGRFVSQFNTRQRPSYGVYFSVDASDRFVYFVDIDNDEWFRSGQVPSTCDVNEECLDIIEITRTDRIIALCAGNNSSTVTDTTCTEGSNYSVDDLHISFERPFPEAVIRDENGTIHDNAEIVVSSPRGQTLSVIVWRTGQISVRNK